MIEQHASLSEKFLKKGFWLYLFSFIIAPIGYIVKIILSSELTVSEIGILYGIISLITLLSSYNDLGVTESLKHFIPKYITEKRYDKVKSILFYALFIQFTTSILIAGIFFYGAEYIALNYFNSEFAIETLKVFAFFFIGLNIFQTLNQFSLSVQNTFLNKITDVIRSLFALSIVLFIFFGNFSSLVNYSYAWIVGLYCGLVASFILFYNIYYKKYFKGIKIIYEKKLIKEISKYSLMVFIGVSSATILSQIDMQMIVYLLGTENAGYYTNYLSIIGIPFVIIGPIFAFLFPVFSELSSKGEIKKINKIKSIFSKNFLTIGISINILFFVFSEIIAFILFGEKFIISGEILKYSILFLIFNFLIQINFNLMAGIGMVKKRVQIILIAIIFNFILNLILIKSIGVGGAALATGIGWLIIWGLSEYHLGKKYFVGFDYKFLTKNIVLMGLLGIFSYYNIVKLFEGLSRFNALLGMSLIGIIWFIIFGLINLKEFKIFIGEIKKLRKNKTGIKQSTE